MRMATSGDLDRIKKGFTKRLDKANCEYAYVRFAGSITATSGMPDEMAFTASQLAELLTFMKQASSEFIEKMYSEENK